MQRTISAAVIFFALICGPCLAGQAGKRMTNQDIKDLVAVGLSSDVILDKIHGTAATDFDTSVEALKALKAAHVPDVVIRAMMNPHGATAAPPVLATPVPNRMTNQDIKDLVGIGLSNNVIIEKIQGAETTDFDTSVEALKTLKAAQVPDGVIRLMINPHAVPTATSTATSTSTMASTATSPVDAPSRPVESNSHISPNAPLQGVMAVQIDSTVVSDASKVKEPSASTLVQDSLKNAFRSANIDIAESAPIRAHIVLDEFTSGSTAKRMLVGFGAGRSSVTCRLVLQDAAGKQLSSTKIHVRGKLAFSPYEGNNTQRKQAVTSYEQKLLEQIEWLKLGG